MNPLFLYIFCLLISAQTYTQFNRSFSSEMPSSWAHQVVTSLNPEETTLCLNTLYLLYANSLIAHKIHRVRAPLAQLVQSVLGQMDSLDLDEKLESVEILKKLLNKITILAGTRKIYNRMLESCMNHFNERTPSNLEVLLSQFKNDGNTLLNDLLQSNSSELIEAHQLSVEQLVNHGSALQEIIRLHLLVSHEARLTKAIKESYNSDFSYIVLAEDLARNGAIAVHNGELLLNDLNASYDFVERFVGITQDVYYAYYKALYDQMTSSDQLSNQAVALFGLTGILPNDCVMPLPQPDNVFEHALQTAKLYTQVEVTQ